MELHKEPRMLVEPEHMPASVERVSRCLPGCGVKKPHITR